MLCKVLKTVQLLLHVLRNFFNGAATLPLGNGVNKSTLIRNGSHKKPLMLCKSKIVVYLFTPFDMNSFDSFINWIYCIAEGGGIFSLKSFRCFCMFNIWILRLFFVWSSRSKLRKAMQMMGVASEACIRPPSCVSYERVPVHVLSLALPVVPKVNKQFLITFYLQQIRIVPQELSTQSLLVPLSGFHFSSVTKIPSACSKDRTTHHDSK